MENRLQEMDYFPIWPGKSIEWLINLKHENYLFNPLK